MKVSYMYVAFCLLNIYTMHSFYLCFHVIYFQQLFFPTICSTYYSEEEEGVELFNGEF
jgi:hypothetical protein